MQRCSPIFKPRAIDPFSGVYAPLPLAAFWFNNRDLAKTRLNQMALSDGWKDDGSNGAVHFVQLALRHWGVKLKAQPSLLLPVFGPDGAYGSETMAAVQAFQRESTDETGVKETLVDGHCVVFPHCSLTLQPNAAAKTRAALGASVLSRLFGSERFAPRWCSSSPANARARNSGSSVQKSLDRRGGNAAAG